MDKSGGFTARFGKGSGYLHFRAISRGNLIRLRAILNEQSEIKDIPNKQGDTPLLCAVKHNSFNCFKYLVSIGCDPTIPDTEGDTVIDIILEKKLVEYAFVLLKAGHDLNISHLTLRQQEIYFYTATVLLQNYGQDNVNFYYCFLTLDWDATIYIQVFDEGLNIYAESPEFPRELKYLLINKPWYDGFESRDRYVIQTQLEYPFREKTLLNLIQTMYTEIMDIFFNAICERRCSLFIR